MVQIKMVKTMKATHQGKLIANLKINRNFSEKKICLFKC